MGDGIFFLKKMGTSLIGGGVNKICSLSQETMSTSIMQRKNGIIQILNVYPIYF